MERVCVGTVALRCHRLCWVDGVMNIGIQFLLVYAAILLCIGWAVRKRVKRNRWVRSDAWKPTGSHPSFWSRESRGQTMCR